MLAMVANDNACFLAKPAALESIASKLAPTACKILKGASSRRLRWGGRVPGPFAACGSTPRRS
ncbi:hypothetical protein PSJE_26420 [Pseudomonas jessenii]|nr:hypothetical protein PSJE_26420 [Pseudomonas jessenii]